MSEAVGVSESALGKYETGDFVDISPFSIVKLTKFYSVTTDYLMGVSNIDKEADAEIYELRLTNDALNMLKSGKFNGMLLSEVMIDRNFQRLLKHMEFLLTILAVCKLAV